MGLEAQDNFNNNKIKRLPPSVVKDIELKNQARKLAGLAAIKVKIRTCISCTQLFESQIYKCISSVLSYINVSNISSLSHTLNEFYLTKFSPEFQLRFYVQFEIISK